MLRKYLFKRILSSGKMTFAEFMSEALYNDSYGYYSSGRARIGKRGDYYTSPSVHSVFGDLICNQIVEMWRIIGEGKFTIVEMGAGDGTLSDYILRCARNEHLSFYENLSYVIIEKNRHLMDIQKNKFQDHEDIDNKIIWAADSARIFDGGITGCVLSKELADAFPVHVVEQREGELKEVFVDYRDGHFIEVLDSPSTSRLQEYFDRLEIALEDGQRAEVNLEAVDWIKRVAASLKKGFVITIDYGYPADELYAPHRKDGTLLCYHKHRVAEDPYQNIGEQDMTTHVDFTTLISAGTKAGLQMAGMTDQMHFLFSLGIGKRIEEISLKAGNESEALQERLRIKNLIMPGRLGNIFKVLIQYKGLEDRPLLSGLSGMFK